MGRKTKTRYSTELQFCVCQRCRLHSEIVALVHHMISHQQPIPICPSGVMCLNAPQRFWRTLFLELLFTPFHPSMPLSPLQCRIMSLLFRNSTPRTTGVLGSPDFLPPRPPLPKPPPASQLPARRKVTALSAKCGRCFSGISWRMENGLSLPECKRSTLSMSPWKPVFGLGWLARHSLPHKGCSCAVWKTHKRTYTERPSPYYPQLEQRRFRLSSNPVVGKSTLFYRQPELETSTENK